MPIKSINKVTDKDIEEALEYLWSMGFTQEMTSDKKHYTEILCKAGADKLGIKLEE